MIETSVGGATVREVEPEIPPDLAMIVVVPTATRVAFPFDLTALLIMATDFAEELQVTDVVRFRVLLSEYVPMAVNCAVVPIAIEGFIGITATETSLFSAALLVVTPPQTIARTTISKRMIILFDFIDTHSERD